MGMRWWWCRGLCPCSNVLAEATDHPSLLRGWEAQWGPLGICLLLRRVQCTCTHKQGLNISCQACNKFSRKKKDGRFSRGSYTTTAANLTTKSNSSVGIVLFIIMRLSPFPLQPFCSLTTYNIYPAAARFQQQVVFAWEDERAGPGELCCSMSLYLD